MTPTRYEPLRLVLIPSAVLVGVLAFLAAYGLGAQSPWPAVGMGALAMASFLGVEEHLRTKVTPASDPRDNTGRPLVPSGDPHAWHHYEDVNR